MPNTLPITIVMGSLPPRVRWKIQQLADAMVERMSLQTQASFALFAAGSTEPSSNVGPWFNGTSWLYWSNVTGNYQPIILAPESLGYTIGSAAPNPLVFSVWIETTAGGSPLAVKIYYSGAWVDVYAAALVPYLTTAAFNAAIASYSTTAQMTAAIAAAVGGIPASVVGDGSFKARPSAPQAVVFGAGGTQTGTVTLDSEDFDPDGDFAANTFTAPATGYYQFNASIEGERTAGAGVQIELTAFFSVNTVQVDSLNDESLSDEPGNRVLTGSSYYFLTAGDTVRLEYNIIMDAAGTFTISPNNTRLSGYRVR